MTTILQSRTARTTTARAARPDAANTTLALDGVLGRLERTAARLPYALAVPVILVHAALSTLAYR